MNRERSGVQDRTPEQESKAISVTMEIDEFHQEIAMQTNPTTSRTKPGRLARSSYRVQQELRAQEQAQQAKAKPVRGSRARSELHKRQQDRLRRERRQRRQAIRYYRHWRERFSEGEAALRAAQTHGVSVGTIRRWERRYRQGGLAALLPQPRRTGCGNGRIPLPVQWVVVALRRLLGWNEKRMAKELRQRGIAHLSHGAIGNLFRRYHLPTRTYHSKARCDGIAKRRYEKARPNQQWHIDFAETHLRDGSVVRLVALLDDYSRYCLTCAVVPQMTTESAIQAVQAAWQAVGLPAEIVSDNGGAFTSQHTAHPTAFEVLLQHKGIRHRLITPYWPEGNGKAEAFIKILKHECLQHPCATREELQLALAAFVHFYNHFRLHSSLHYQTPASRFLGTASPKNHGLADIPRLPADLYAAFPPLQPVLIPPVNLFSVKRPVALVASAC